MTTVFRRRLEFAVAGAALVPLWFAASALGAVAHRRLVTVEQPAAPIHPRDVAPRVASANRPPSDDRRAMRREIVEHNPFCRACPAAKANEAAGVGLAAVAPSTTLPLRLIATMERSIAENSVATIAHGDDGIVGVYGIGEQIIDGVVVETVGPGTVYLRRGTTRELLEIEAAPAKPPTKPKDRSPPPRKRPWQLPGAAESIECSGKTCTIERAFVDEILANPASLARQGRFSRRAGQGFVVRGARRGSLPRMLGLRNGDLLTSVNGRALDSVDAAMAAYRELRRASHLDVKVKRGKKNLDKRIVIR